MGLASLFRKKTNYFKTNIEPQCAYCQFSRRPEGGTRIVCEKLGLKEETDSCKKFVYSPLKRIPVKQLNIEGAVSDQEMYVEISEEELAAKQAAAARADAAEKVHDENKAKAEAEQKARLAAETRAKQEAEQKARQEAEARAKAEQAKREQEAAAKAAEEAARAKAALDAKAAAETALAEAKAKEDAKAAAAATISEYKARSAELDDEFSDLDMVEEAEVRAAEEHEVMRSKKQRLVAESESPKGAVPNLPPASAFLRNNKKKN